MKENQQYPVYQIENSCLSRTKESSNKHFSKCRIIKNVFVVCLGVLLLFIAYDGLTMLQSTMNHEQGIGVTSQAIVYICFCISSIFFPTYVIQKFGCKATFAVSMLTYIPYIASNFYFHWALVIPTSILMGLGAPLLWGSQAVYLNDISRMYADSILYMNTKTDTSRRKSNKFPNIEEMKMKSNRSLSCDFINIKRIRCNNPDNVILQSYSYQTPKEDNIAVTVKSKSSENIYCIDSCQQYLDYSNLDINDHQINHKSNEHCFESNKSESNLNKKNHQFAIQKKMDERIKIIESVTARFFGFHGFAYLSTHLWSNLMTYYILQSDVTLDDISNSSCVCGADFCNIESACFEHNIEEPSEKIRYILTATCVCIGIISVLVVVFFLDSLESEKVEVTFSLDLLMATYKLAKRKEFILLMPSSFYIGMVQGFYTGDFTKSYIGCAWGTYHVGLVSVCYGAFCGISSTLSGWLVKRLGRIPIFTSAALVNITANIFLLFWRPSAEQPIMFFVAVALWGTYVGVIWSQLRALYGVLFKANEEAAFATFHVWYSLGFCLSFAYSNFFCTSVKIYVLLTVCILGYMGYVAIEILHYKNKIQK